jgi:hypothetical protein
MLDSKKKKTNKKKQNKADLIKKLSRYKSILDYQNKKTVMLSSFEDKNFEKLINSFLI